MKQQAQYIWNRLDDLATTDPNAYKKFIEEQMKERELYNSAPEPRMCVYVETEVAISCSVSNLFNLNPNKKKYNMLCV